MSLARLFRAQADSLPNAGRPRLTAKDQAQKSAILDTATALLATHGRAELSIGALTAAMRIS